LDWERDEPRRSSYDLGSGFRQPGRDSPAAGPPTDAADLLEDEPVYEHVFRVEVQTEGNWERERIAPHWALARGGLRPGDLHTGLRYRAEAFDFVVWQSSDASARAGVAFRRNRRQVIATYSQ
ncbi:MAG: hypothetical protein AAGA56_31555, partial [Myxococcota bacterium]